MKFYNNMMNKAFTLSEILLTMAILGIVAAMTMPGLIASYKNKVYVVQLEKSLSQFEQAMQNIMVKHECTDIVCTSVFDGTSSDAGWNDKINDEITKSIKVVRTYKNGIAAAPHIKSQYLKPRNSYTSNMDWAATEGYKFITPDGVFYHIKNRDCEKTPAGNSAIIRNFCADVTIDVNSERLPNQYGRDLFTFVVAQNGHLYAVNGSEYAIALHGDNGLTSNDYWENNIDACAGNVQNDYTITSVKGLGCAARIMGQGWKMDY